MTAQEIREYWHRENDKGNFAYSSDIRLSAELAAQHAERNELLRAFMRMQTDAELIVQMTPDRIERMAFSIMGATNCEFDESQAKRIIGIVIKAIEATV